MTEPTTSLRPLEVADAEELFDEVFADGDPDPDGYLMKNGRPSTIDERRPTVDWFLAGQAVGQLRSYVLLNESGRVVGWGLITKGENGDRPEISFMVGPKHRRCGHAGRAVQLLADVALEVAPEGVEAVVDVENDSVVRMLEACGFERILPALPGSTEETWLKLPET